MRRLAIELGVKLAAMQGIWWHKLELKTLRSGIERMRLSREKSSKDRKRHRLSQTVPSGGGGNRTRVPRCFRIGLYVCSHWFKVRSFNRAETP